MIIWKYDKKPLVLLLAVLDIFVGLQNVFLAFITSFFFQAATEENLSLFIRTALFAIVGFTLISTFNYLHVNLKNYVVQVTNLSIKKHVINNQIYTPINNLTTGENVSSLTADLKLLETMVSTTSF